MIVKTLEFKREDNHVDDSIIDNNDPREGNYRRAQQRANVFEYKDDDRSFFSTGTLFITRRKI